MFTRWSMHIVSQNFSMSTMERAASTQHSAAASAMAHRMSPQRKPFNCLIPWACPLSAPCQHGRLADLLPDTNHHWK